MDAKVITIRAFQAADGLKWQVLGFSTHPAFIRVKDLCPFLWQWPPGLCASLGALLYLTGVTPEVTAWLQQVKSAAFHSGLDGM